MKVIELLIPQSLKDTLAKDGYDRLYPPQEEALKKGALQGNNIVLASPTASGKTLVAELCILRNVVERDAKALYLTPLRALASEKFQDFQKYREVRKASGEKVRVALTTGDYDSSDQWIGKYDIIVATNEKADSILRHRASWISELSIVVADEVHLLTEPERGPTLEVVLTRLRQINPNIQILALSATISNADEVAEWLNAIPITTEWRPVPLREGVYLDGEISFRDGTAEVVEASSGQPISDIAMRVVREKGQVLIFAETRRRAVEISRKVSNVLRESLSKPELRALASLAHTVLTSGEKTKLSELLAAQVANGGAFHHAGCAAVHRRIVEDAFREGRIKVLSATPTLAAGVNLPARTVIVSSYERYEPGYGRYPISVLEYKQFCGRAGRPRYDNYGEAVLLSKTADEQDFLMEKYVLSKPERLWSKLAVEKVLRPHVLATIAAGYARTEEGLHDFFAGTFYAQQYGAKAIKPKIGSILAFLCKENMTELEGRRIYATNFGRRVSELYIDPVSAVTIREGFINRAKKMTELSFLHLISHTPDISPKLYPRRGESNELGLFAEERTDEFMFDVPEVLDDTLAYEEFLAELKCARVLLDWIDESTEDTILSKFRVEPGDLLRLVEIADWLLYSSHELAKLFNHTDVLKPLLELRMRVETGVKSELTSLVQLKGIGRVRARMLYRAGFRSISDLKTASVTSLMEIPSIGPLVAKSIKEQVGGKITSEEWETLRRSREYIRRQKLMSEY